VASTIYAMDSISLAMHVGARLISPKTFESLLTTIRTAVTSGPAPLSEQERRTIERAYAVVRELCLYYAALMAAGGTDIPAPVRHEILTRICTLYSELAAVKRTKVELSEDPWYDVEENFAPTIRIWIQAHNDTILTSSTEKSPYIVVPIPPPQT
jgi:hypothetical protein